MKRRDWRWFDHGHHLSDEKLGQSCTYCGWWLTAAESQSPHYLHNHGDLSVHVPPDMDGNLQQCLYGQILLFQDGRKDDT